MMQQIDSFLSKKPDRRTLTIVMVILVTLCLCCMCLAFYLWRGVPVQVTPTATSTPTLTPTPTATLTPSLTPTETPTTSVTPSETPTLTPSITPSETSTLTPSFTPTITPTPNPLSGAEHLAVFVRTGSVWVTSRHNNRLVELDGGDLHVLSIIEVDSPNGIAIWEEKGLAYITNRNPGTVTEVDLVAHSVTRTIPVGKEPLGVTVVQTTGAVFVANFASNDISCIPPGVGQAITAVPTRIELSGPVALVGFPYNENVPNTALVVDSIGQVAITGLVNSSNFKSVRTAPCVISPITTIEKDVLVGVAQSTSNNLWFFVSDKSGKKAILLPNIQDLSTPTELALPESPGAVLDLGRCVAAVVPAQNRVYFMDLGLTKAYKRVNVGKQGNEGGQGLAYNPQWNIVYVANAAENSVTRIDQPCN